MPALTWRMLVRSVEGDAGGEKRVGRGEQEEHRACRHLRTLPLSSRASAASVSPRVEQGPRASATAASNWCVNVKFSEFGREEEQTKESATTGIIMWQNPTPCLLERRGRAARLRGGSEGCGGEQ
eukprot:1355833-Rhodomonas_salina.1